MIEKKKFYNYISRGIKTRVNCEIAPIANIPLENIYNGGFLLCPIRNKLSHDRLFKNKLVQFKNRTVALHLAFDTATVLQPNKGNKVIVHMKYILTCCRVPRMIRESTLDVRFDAEKAITGAQECRC